MYFEFNNTNTFCISLYNNHVRWEKMVKRFLQTDLEVTRYRAICDNSELNDTFAYYLTPSQKFCSQSHINLWKHIVNNKLPYAFILEDDACFDIEWKNKLNRFYTEINDPEWDAIFLNASEPSSDIDKWIIADDQYLTGGYILSNKGANLLLNMFSSYYHSSDWMTSRLQKNKHSYTYFPWLIIQEGNESTINSNVDADHKKVLNCLNNISYSLSNYNI